MEKLWLEEWICCLLVYSVLFSCLNKQWTISFHIFWSLSEPNVWYALELMYVETRALSHESWVLPLEDMLPKGPCWGREEWDYDDILRPTGNKNHRTFLTIVFGCSMLVMLICRQTNNIPSFFSDGSRLVTSFWKVVIFAGNLVCLMSSYVRHSKAA